MERPNDICLIHWDHIYSSNPFQTSTSTNSLDNGLQVQNDYAKSMPSINGPPYHNKFSLEAQEPPSRQPFPETLIGRLPPEIREKIYIAALRIHEAPKNTLHYNWQEGKNQPPPPERIRDHQPVSIRYRERRWPKTVQQQDEQHALLATFPPLANPKAQSRLALLLTCSEIYTEAWHLYYSTNIFDFPTLFNFIQFRRYIGLKRGAELTSIALTFVGSEDDELLLDEALECLAECRHLQYLKLRLCWNNRHYFGLLERLRGLKRVDLLIGHWFVGWWTWRLVQGEEREAAERAMEEVRRLLLRPE